jgi:alkanesulfonate monooxygenase SsuD/methylene tetrahydromethanopterin reductase-like flavin-dependent oxidoreductase (luciferase family)
VKIGLVLPLPSGAERVLSFARRAEELGFDGLFAFDHLFPPGAPADRPSLEAYATLAAVSAVTDRVAIGTLVTRASLRTAGMLAEQVVSLDDASHGRFVLGIGTGDALSRAEHEAFGLPFLGPAIRREHLAETVGALRALFGGMAWPGGEHVPPIAGPLLPQPARIGGPPIWIGGASEGATRLAAHVADGWNGWGLPVSVFADRVRLLASEAAGRAVEPTWGGAAVIGRDAGEADALVEERRRRGLDQSWWGSAAEAVRWLDELRAAGAAWAILLAAGATDRMELIGERVLPRLGRPA